MAVTHPITSSQRVHNRILQPGAGVETSQWRGAGAKEQRRHPRKQQLRDNTIAHVSSGDQHVEPGSVEDTCATELRDGEQQFCEVQSGKRVEHSSRSDALASEDCDGEQRLRQGDPPVEHSSAQEACATEPRW